MRRNLAKADAAGPSVVMVSQLELLTVTFCVEGDSPLLLARFAEEAKQMMRVKHQGLAAAAGPRKKKDPWADFCNGINWMSERPAGRVSVEQINKARIGAPSLWFKCAMIEAASQCSAITKVDVRAAIRVLGEVVRDSETGNAVSLLEVVGPRRMREDPVRNSGPGKSADLRYRAEFWPWSIMVPIRFNPAIFTVEQVANLLNLSGQVGVGQWRAQRNGEMGYYHVAETAKSRAKVG